MICKVTMASGKIYTVTAVNLAHANAEAISVALRDIGPEAFNHSEMDIIDVEIIGKEYKSKPAIMHWPIILKFHGYTASELMKILRDQTSRDSVKLSHDIMDKAVREAIPKEYCVHLGTQWDGGITIELIPTKGAQ
jgi:hypothetical protein